MTRIEKFLLLLACLCALLSLFVYPLNSLGESTGTNPVLQIFCGLALLVVAVGYALENVVVR